MKSDMYNCEQGNDLWQIFYAGLWACVVLCWGGIIFRVENMPSILYAISMLFVACIGFCSLHKNINDVKNSLLLMLLVSCSIIITTLFSNYSITLFKQMVQYFVLFLLMFLMQFYTINKVNYNIMFFSTILVGIMFIVGYMVYPDVKMAGGITLNFHNPNATGMVITLNTLFMVAMCNQRRWLYKLFVYIIAGFDVYILFLTLSRNAIISCIVGLLLNLIISRQYLKVKKFNIIVMLNIPILFILLYMGLFKSNIIPDDFIIGDKALFSGRQNVWNEIFLEYLNDPKNIFVGLGISGKNNSQLSLILSFGVIGFVIIMCFIIKYVFVLNDISSVHTRKNVWLFLSMMLLGCAESAIFTGYLMTYIYIGTYLQIEKYAVLENNCVVNNEANSIYKEYILLRKYI